MLVRKQRYPLHSFEYSSPGAQKQHGSRIITLTIIIMICLYSVPQ